MCLNLAGDEHKGQEGSSSTQRFRFCSDGRTSYVDLMRKLILLLFHCPKVLPAQLALLHTLPSHPLSLLGLGNGLYTPHPLPCPEIVLEQHLY